MSRRNAKHDQLSLTLRVAAGVYLIYTAWTLRTAVAENPLFLAAVIIFGIAGIIIAAHGGWRLWKGLYEKPGDSEEQEPETEE